ncbi:hypothetical protein F503_03072 [Ophiostoma piceae UAMH 11346]|uniref:Uncharacterized protein n=1 Tax=Ophiostoma piceae (strain UAMH 11346) TaxID=1262450 RepID=S3D096_OPHP1|nr:hypothetical protein F503_03072 [Ophiostoma piceae UAMH 11346]
MEQLEQPNLTPKRSTPTTTRIKARFQGRPSRLFRTVFEQGPEQMLPVALLFGLVASMGSVFTSASMLYLHFPVHTVLCRAQKIASSSSNTPTTCYPNFFLSTWVLIFCASILSGFFYTFLCMQQEQLRLRQSVAMLGSFFTMFLWLSTILFGFLPAEVSIDSSSISNNRGGPVPHVHAHGMLSSSIENYMYAHNKTRMPSITGVGQGKAASLI